MTVTIHISLNDEIYIESSNDVVKIKLNKRGRIVKERYLRIGGSS